MSKICIVEDDTFLQGLLSTKLSTSGYEVMTVSDGNEAVKKIEEGKPSLVLLDLMLPGTSGFDILEDIRKNGDLKNLPVIVFSNLSEDVDISRAKELGATEFMIKSNFTLDELLEKVKSNVG